MSSVGATGADVGSLETSLRGLVGQVRAQLEVLQRDNETKDAEIDQYKMKISALEKLIENKGETENRLMIEKNEMKQQFDMQNAKQESIQAKLINQISKLRSEMENLELRYRTDLTNNTKQYTFEIDQLTRQYQTSKMENESLKQKIENLIQQQETIEQNAKANYAKYEAIQDRLNSEIKILKAEKENGGKDIIHLQERITKTNQDVYNLQKSNLDLKNENKMANAKLEASLNNIKYLKKQIEYYQSQSKLINNALNGNMTMMEENHENDNNINNNETNENDNSNNNNKKKNKNNNMNDGKAEMIENEMSSMSHAPHGMKIDTIKLGNLTKMPKRIKELESELKEKESLLLQERQKTTEIIFQLQQRVHDSGSHILRIQQKSEDLENRIEQYRNENDQLAKHNESLRTELENKVKMQSTTQTFYQMRRQEDMKNLNSLQKQVEQLQDALRRKEIEKCDRDAKISQLRDELLDAKNNYQREIGLLKQKMASLTQLSQEEIQQAFHLTMSELQGILDVTSKKQSRSNMTARTNGTNETSVSNATNVTNIEKNNRMNEIHGNGASSSKIIGELIKSLEKEKTQRRALETQVSKWREIAFNNEKKIHQLTDQQNMIEKKEAVEALSQSKSVTPHRNGNDNNENENDNENERASSDDNNQDEKSKHLKHKHSKRSKLTSSMTPTPARVHCDQTPNGELTNNNSFGMGLEPNVAPLIQTQSVDSGYDAETEKFANSNVMSDTSAIVSPRNTNGNNDNDNDIDNDNDNDNNSDNNNDNQGSKISDVSMEKATTQANGNMSKSEKRSENKENAHGIRQSVEIESNHKLVSEHNELIEQNENYFLDDEGDAMLILHESMVEKKYKDDNQHNNGNANQNENENEDLKKSKLTQNEYANTNLSDLTGFKMTTKDDIKDGSSEVSRKRLTNDELEMLNNEENFQDYKAFKEQSELVDNSIENALKTNNDNRQEKKRQDNMNAELHPIDCINEDDIETTDHGYHSKNKSHFFNFFNVW